MKVIYNNIIPFNGFIAMNFFGMIFVRNKFKNLYFLKRTFNHEGIHTAQMKELGFVFFYILYIIEWIIRLLFTADFFSHSAYRNISFEQEALINDEDYDYLKKGNRKHYSSFKYLFKRSFNRQNKPI